MGVSGQRHSPAALTPVETRYLFDRRLDGHRGRSGRVQKVSPPPPPQGFEPKIVQPDWLERHSWITTTDNHIAFLRMCVTVDFLHCSFHASLLQIEYHFCIGLRSGVPKFDLCLAVHALGPSYKRSRLKYQWSNRIAVRFVTMLAPCTYLVLNGNHFHVCLKILREYKFRWPVCPLRSLFLCLKQITALQASAFLFFIFALKLTWPPSGTFCCCSEISVAIIYIILIMLLNLVGILQTKQQLLIALSIVLI